MGRKGIPGCNRGKPDILQDNQEQAAAEEGSRVPLDKAVDDVAAAVAVAGLWRNRKSAEEGIHMESASASHKVQRTAELDTEGTDSPEVRPVRTDYDWVEVQYRRSRVGQLARFGSQ